MPTYIITAENKIIATTRSLSNDNSPLQALNDKNNNISILECDIASPKSIHDFVDSLKGKFDKIDYVVNNAGQNAVPDATSLTISGEDLIKEMQTNVLGPATLISYLLAAGVLARDVRVLNMSSGLGSMAVSGGIEPRRCAVYSISKAGVDMLTVHQAYDLRKALVEEKSGEGEGPVVICMDPGWVKTRMGGEGALLEAEHSIAGMLKVLYKIQPADSGKFFSHEGRIVPW